ncbi:MAG: hypothetical protein EXQ74_07410 [Thermoleophilia bacterium]|nr:hypothetical protein [Thermoleophilia bacterium]
MSTVDALVEEFRAAYVAGQRPDAGAFVDRATEAARNEVGRRIRVVLAETSPPNPAPETLLMAEAMLRGQPPLLELRSSKGLTRDAVVHRLRELLGVAPTDEARVATYYHELETGQLPLAGVRDRVFDAVAHVMGVPRAALVLTGPDVSVAQAPQAMFARADATLDLPSPGALAPAPRERGDVDDLFTGGPG